MWVIVAACLVMFMQAGLRVPGDRLLAGQERRNRGREDPHELLDRGSGWWACGFAFAFGAGGGCIGHDGGFFFTDLGPWSATRGRFRPDFPVMSLSDATIEAKFFFQFVFCAVSLAIVWGTTLERIKFGAYVIYAIVFSHADLSDRRPLGIRRRLPADR